MFCTRCGNRLDDDCVFCPYCGSKVDSAETMNWQSAGNSNGGTREKPESGKKTSPVFVIIGLIAVAAVILWLSFMTSGGTLSVPESDTVSIYEDFQIKGTWKNVGEATFGQIQEDAIVVFNGQNCNVFSPYDTYAFYKENSEFRLDCTSVGFAETVSFPVTIIDENNIELGLSDGSCVELTRVEQ